MTGDLLRRNLVTEPHTRGVCAQRISHVKQQQDGGHLHTTERGLRRNHHAATFILLFSRFIHSFIERERHREREKECEHEEVMGRERIPTRPHTASTEPDAGLEPTNCETMT